MIKYSHHGFEVNAVLMLLEREGGSFRLDGSKTIQKKYLRMVADLLAPQDDESVQSGTELRSENRFRWALRWLKDDGRIKFHGHGHYEITEAGRAFVRALKEELEEVEVTGLDEVTTRYRRLDLSLESTEVVRDLTNGATLISVEDDHGGAEFLCESGEGLTDADLTDE